LVILVKAFFPKPKKLVNVAAMSSENEQSGEECVSGDAISESAVPAADIPGAAPGKALSPEAVRALLEAEARRQAAPAEGLPPEINGRREGEEPTRYGDWEKKGLAVDF
jgi:hypothetical protein